MLNPVMAVDLGSRGGHRVEVVTGRGEALNSREGPVCPGQRFLVPPSERKNFSREPLVVRATLVGLQQPATVRRHGSREVEHGAERPRPCSVETGERCGVRETGQCGEEIHVSCGGKRELRLPAVTLSRPFGGDRPSAGPHRQPTAAQLYGMTSTDLSVPVCSFAGPLPMALHTSRRTVPPLRSLRAPVDDLRPRAWVYSSQPGTGSVAK